MRFRIFAPLLLALLAASQALAQGGRATGQVVDTDGKPVDGVRLRLVSESGESAPGAAGSIEVKKGRFTIPSFPSGGYHFEVEGSSLAIQHFEIEVRDSNGTRLDTRSTDVPPGSKAPTIELGGSQRAAFKVTLGPAAASAGTSAAGLAAAKGASAGLQKLNELLAQNDMPGLLAESERILASKPDLAGARYLHAVALWKTGRVEEAAPEMRKAIELDPQPELQSVLGAMLLDLSAKQAEAGKDADSKAAASEAADIFAKETAAHPADTNAITNRVIALERAGRTEEVLRAIETLVAADPSNVKAYNRAAEILLDAGRPQEALAWLDKSPAKDLDTATRAYNIAVSLYNQGKALEAADAMRKVIGYAPDAPFAHQLLGNALLTLGDKQGSVKELEEFLRLAPQDPDADSTRKLVAEIRKSLK